MSTDTAYRDDMHEKMQQLIGLAWADPDFKALLIANPGEAFAQIAIEWPEEHRVEFYDAPDAELGSWTMSGQGKDAVLRVPIPSIPDEASVSDDDLAQIGGAQSHKSTVMCCCCLLSGGVVSQDDWV
ncbi:hypothetical protein GCM10009808_03920 [Microbacterium sediminicola]|uniref:NHLP leader peptide family natural product n=1 Tax=Microbacterium sediminicola TaxID=415210 RepID=A0ABN2HM77_9MICO